MMTRLRRLYRRFACIHFRCARDGFDIAGADGALIGRVESCQLRGDRLHLSGWADCERVVVEDETARREVAPWIWRQDVVDRGAGNGPVGFEVDLPANRSAVRISVETRRGAVGRKVPAFPRRRVLIAEIRTRVVFMVGLLRSAPAVLRWALWRHPSDRAAVKRRLGLEGAAPAGCPKIRTGLFVTGKTPSRRSSKVTLVMPVYNAFDLTREALSRILANTDLPWRLILVEDASTDARMRPFLRGFRDNAPAGAVTLIENPKNLGFVGSANRGLAEALAHDDHVVLVNSDAMVPRGWVARLLAPILDDRRVASVTPMSNDAEIFSVPVACRPRPLAPGEAQAIDAAARRINVHAGPVDAPTGVGFCMAMNIDFLRRFPAFDPAFGRGYGEEVDWCQRTRLAGGRHVCQPALFVEHRGGQSFGNTEKARLIAEHNAIVARRYPGYDAEVQGFIRTDPLGDARLALGIALAAARQEASGKALDIYVAHSLGGGAEMDLARRLRHVTEEGLAAVVLRFGGPALCRVELHMPVGASRIDTDDWRDVDHLLAPALRRRIIYSNGVGHPDPIALPDQILSLRRDERDRIEILIHDFFPLSPSYCLLGAAGRYRGVPAADDEDPAHLSRRPDGGRVTLRRWRAAWGRLLDAAESVTVFAESGREIVAEAYPEVAARIVVRPHAPLHVPGRARVPEGGRLNVGVLGNIGWQKGIAVVGELARSPAALSGDFAIVVIGNADPAYRLPAGVHVHGSYRPEDLPLLAARYEVGLWLIPSIWPETFSFTAREAIATGLPTYAFDLGGQGEAVRETPNGRPVRFDPDAPHAEVLIDAWRQDGLLKPAASMPLAIGTASPETVRLPAA